MATDPIGHFAAKTAKLEAEVAQTREAREAQEAESQFVGTYIRSAQALRTTAPDFDAA
jgi:hypothetical protein